MIFGDALFNLMENKKYHANVTKVAFFFHKAVLLIYDFINLLNRKDNKVSVLTSG